MSLTEGTYEEERPRRMMSKWRLVLTLAAILSLIVIGFTGLIYNRYWLIVPILLLIAGRILDRLERRRRRLSSS
ncbi:MAG: hypothetical protein SFV54_06685 [Bryobacteraceae bacterium]|nr:hypothetical protein [Bryobacteraceae bacterium]